MEYLKKAKKEKKLTLQEISNLSGIPKRTVDDIFSGHTKNPRIDTLQAIERALGIHQPPLEWTDEDKENGAKPQHKEILTEDEIEILDAYRAIKSEKGDKSAEAIKILLQAFLDKK